NVPLPASNEPVSGEAAIDVDEYERKAASAVATNAFSNMKMIRFMVESMRLTQPFGGVLLPFKDSKSFAEIRICRRLFVQINVNADRRP
ncbi:MAG: hypothetical protein K2N66_03960, partial [Paramuribaculum sp.]|nr:hypothetical protein [Paramuribaculum sp.]